MTNHCPDCGADVTPSDSDVTGVCVDCQEYDYYHQVPNPKEVRVNMLLFEGHFDQRDGDHEYTSKRQVAAPNIQEANEFFTKELLEWFGEETVVEDRYDDGTVRMVTNSIGYPIVKMSWVAQLLVTAVEGTDGKMYHFTQVRDEED